MHGTLDVRRIGSNGETYQVRYEDLAGDSFTGRMNHEQVHELLYDKLGLNLTDEELNRAYDHITRDGHVTFPEIEIREEELTGAGLKYLEAEG